MIPDVLLKPAQSLLDRGVDNSTTAAALCAQLEGRTLQISPVPSELGLYFAVTNGQLQVNAGAVENPDAIISGSLVNLARLAGSDPEDVIRDGHVSISGDADIAENFQTLLALTRPDWEEELSKVTGDALAHEAGRVFRGVAGWAARARHSLGRSVAEYLSEESRDLVATTELKEFYADVDQLAMNVERAEARLRIIKEHSIKNSKDRGSVSK
jgi:ubiquinone biosynthesis protein UbiJ